MHRQMDSRLHLCVHMFAVLRLSLSLACNVPSSLTQSYRGQDLYGFYQGLALKLAQKLSLARTESIRLSMLKAFNDRQSVLHLEDELERLKVHAIHTFDLPVNEKILFTSKATYR